MSPTLKTIFLELSHLPGRPATESETRLAARIQKLTAHICPILQYLRESNSVSEAWISAKEREIFGLEGFCLLPPPTITKPQETT